MMELVAKNYIVEKNKANDFTKMMNAIMFQGECCGIRGLTDFDINVTIVIGTVGFPTTYVIRTPAACCPREHFLEEDETTAFVEVIGCISDNWAARTMREGVQGIILFMIILRPPQKPQRKSAASSAASSRSGTRAQKPDVQELSILASECSEIRKDNMEKPRSESKF
ncbi:hypothetical protein PoB_007236800 [Plakobranchus ocellatus]|uniref:Uncharacterized protein n=1 Tax=Plakobranchus ocellatus TaxID=259542 RepID=A0AAV4DP76_9GAST|nr:hypothetical protein PoB_007236800 [Plakobranchus ocellatus]